MTERASPRRSPHVDDHPNGGPHTECQVDHGGKGVPRHCRRGCKWPCPAAPRCTYINPNGRACGLPESLHASVARGSTHDFTRSEEPSCDCGAGVTMPWPCHSDNCPVLIAWLMQSVPTGEVEVAEATELADLDRLNLPAASAPSDGEST